MLTVAFTLSATDASTTVGETTTVNVTGITGSISVISDNENAATASYNEGVVTISGKNNGVANIIVKGSNDGLELSQTIVATGGEVAATTVTVNYLCNDEAIADPLILSDVSVGSILTASDITYESVIYGANARYINPIFDKDIPYVVEANGVINITYTAQAAVTNVKKIVKAGENVYSNTNVALENKYVGDNVSFSYPLYINYNGTLYSKAAINSQYNQSFTLTENNQECILPYSSTEITGIVYFSEGENIEGATSTSAGSNMPARSSNQACGYTGEDLTLINLPAGIYRAYMVCYSNSSAGSTEHFSFGDETFDASISGASNWKNFNMSFLLESNADVKWLTSGDSKNGLDFIYIQKTGDYYKTMSIVGDFSPNEWDKANGIEMTRDSENPFIWTAVVEDFGVTSAKYNYEYKAIANQNWEDYVLPAGDNQTYNFDYDGAREGTYTLTFTVNTSENTVGLAVEKQATPSTYTIVGCFNNGEEIASFFESAWVPTATDNDMVNNGDDTYTKVFENVTLDAGTIYYKVVENHDWNNNSWGFDENNADYIVNAAGTYHIIFTFNPNSTLANGYNLSCELIPATVTKTMTAAGYATYCSPYALDFTGVDGLTAYIAKVSGDNITFEEVTEAIPANTGILLKGNAANYNIPTVLSADAVENNVFVGVTADTSVDAAIFVLMNGTEGVGFYKTKNEFTVGANTAYIPADAVAGARMFIGFNEEATAIEAVNSDKTNGEMFNLNGQRVQKPSKGLYIVNGKKVNIK